MVFNVNPKSWHFRLLEINAFWKINPNRGSWDYGRWIDRRLPDDFCGYWRKVIFTLLADLVVLAMAIALIMTMGYQTYKDPIGALVFVGVLICTIFGFLGIMAIGYWFENMENRPSRDKNPSIIAMKYRSWKNKYCPKVEYDFYKKKVENEYYDE